EAVEVGRLEVAPPAVAELVEPLLVGQEQDNVGWSRHRSRPSPAPTAGSRRSGRRGRRRRGRRYGRSAAGAGIGARDGDAALAVQNPERYLARLDRLEDVVLLTAQPEGGDRPGLGLTLADLVLLGLDLDLGRAYVLERLRHRGGDIEPLDHECGIAAVAAGPERRGAEEPVPQGVLETLSGRGR